MNVSTIAAITVVLLDFYVGALYCTKLIRKEISPRIATWLIFEIGVVMSLASYLAGNDHSLIKAALNAADSLQVTVILVTLVIVQRGRKIQFTRNELVSLGISCMATVAWMVTKTGWIGFIGFQSVMSVAYLPTIESLSRWKLGPSPEPIEKWGVNVIIALIGIGYGSFARRENRRIFIKLALLRPSGLVGIQGYSGRKRSYVPFLALLAA
jgi:hypothetical protein